MTSPQQAAGRVIVVLGMHRSGTSMLTHCIHLLGADIASEIIAPDSAINRDGFFEDAKIVALNDQLLSLLGRHWFDYRGVANEAVSEEAIQSWQNEALTHLRQEYAGKRLAVIKDPRIGRLFSYWVPAFQQAKLIVELVHIVRRPEAVAQSLQVRNGMPPAYGLLLWCAYIFDILKAMENSSAHTTVLYDAFVENSRQNIRTMARLLTIDAANEPDYGRIAAVVGKPRSEPCSAFNNAVALIPESSAFAGQLYQILADQCVDGKQMISSAARQQLEGDYEGLLDRHAAAFTTLRVLTEEHVDLHRELVEIGELHARAQATVAARDDQLAALNGELARVGTELEYAQSIVVERDGQLAELNAQTEAQLAGLRAQTDAQLTALNAQIARYENVWFRRVWRHLRRSQS